MKDSVELIELPDRLRADEMPSTLVSITPPMMIWRNLWFHARLHLGPLLGAGLAAAVLVGALAVGDSMRETLRQLALDRLGQARLAVHTGDRFFREKLAEEVAAQLNTNASAASPGTSPSAATTETAVVLMLDGAVARPDGKARANRVQTLGVDERFWRFAPYRPVFAGQRSNAADGVFLNRALATQLRVGKGDAVLLRVPKPSLLSRDAPVSAQEDTTLTLRLTVQEVVDDREYGRFGLRASQVAPYTAYLPLFRLQERLGLEGRVNLLLIGERHPEPASPAGGPDDDSAASQHPAPVAPVTTKEALGAIRQCWRLEDAQLELRQPGTGGWELRSPRVFLEAPIVEAAFKTAAHSTGVLTYLVNELRVGDRATPYSMVTAAEPPLVPAALAENEIVINAWLADDLKAKPGDSLELAYFVVGPLRQLEERRARFRVHSIVPLAGAYADRSLMPDFPGLTHAENCRDWDAGFAIDTARIREIDQQYWTEHKGTPKAFISLAAGQRLWTNRFGSLTAVRYDAVTHRDWIADHLRQFLDPLALGFGVRPVRAEALDAVAGAQDFGQLFLGFSSFLIVAALLLMALLFQFGVEQRAGEMGILLALGCSPRLVRRLLLWEGTLLVLMASVLGAPLGMVFARAMLGALATTWQGAVHASQLQFHVEASTLQHGVLISVMIGVVTLWYTLRGQGRRAPRALMAGISSDWFAWRPARFSRYLAAGSVTLAAVLVAWAMWKGPAVATGAFFGAGTLLLVSGVAATAVFLRSLVDVSPQHDEAAAAALPSLAGLGVRNLSRRHTRSLATVGLLACGCFMIVAVSAYRQDASRSAGQRTSGTGGFALVAESTVPVVQDLNRPVGREFFGLNERELAGAQLVPFRVQDGDEASCLNLNRAQRPRLLGVDPEALAARGAFRFAEVAPGVDRAHPWRALHSTARTPADEVPAIGDINSITWALGKRVGDALEYTDERGRHFKVRLVGAVANSILQGALIISEADFLARFPSVSGYRFFLIDAPADAQAQVAGELSRGLRDLGLELTAAVDRLAAFNSVQNSYLNAFQVLGGLGLLLGSFGLGVVVMRNVLERHGELAVLRALGFRHRSIRWLLFSEHTTLLLIGLAAGLAAAGVAILPALLAPGADFPFRSLGITLAAVFVNGLLWMWAATAVSLRAPLLKALRTE